MVVGSSGVGDYDLDLTGTGGEISLRVERPIAARSAGGSDRLGRPTC